MYFLHSNIQNKYRNAKIIEEINLWLKNYNVEECLNISFQTRWKLNFKAT